MAVYQNISNPHRLRVECVISRFKCNVRPHPTPEDVLTACLEQGSEHAWTSFVQMFQPLIASSIARVLSRYSSANAVLIDDLTQDTFLRLCRENARLLREFDSRHENAIFGYIKVIATSVALDHFRARSAQKRGVEISAEEVRREPQARSGSVEQEVLLGQIEARLAASESERDRTIFWLYYRQGYTTREIADLPGLSLTQKGVESCIHRITCLLRQESGSRWGEVHRAEGNQSRNALGEMK